MAPEGSDISKTLNLLMKKSSKRDSLAIGLDWKKKASLRSKARKAEVSVVADFSGGCISF